MCIRDSAITAALEEFTIPLKKARDAIIKSGEIQYISFRLAYDEAVENYRTAHGTVPAAVKKAIAKTLALELMPMIYGKWSNEKTLLQIINDKRIDSDEGRIDVSFQEQKNIDMAIKQGHRFKRTVSHKTQSVHAQAFNRDYVEPGVSMYSNTIQNIDSILLGEAMLENPEVLAIYDALMSNITDAVGNADSYNEAFRDVSADFSILENALKRLQSVKGNSINIKEVNKVYRDGKKDEKGRWIFEPSFEAKALRKRIKFQGKGDGVIVVGTGSSLNVMKKQVQEFRDKGYDAQMMFVETSKDIAIGESHCELKASSLCIPFIF